MAKNNRCSILGVSAVLAVAAPWAQAVTAVGTITDIWTYANGNVLVNGVNFGTTSCSLSHGFIVVYGSDGYKSIMATILSARATGAQIEVSASTPGGCWYPTVTNPGGGYVRLLN